MQPTTVQVCSLLALNCRKAFLYVATTKQNVYINWSCSVHAILFQLRYILVRNVYTIQYNRIVSCRCRVKLWIDCAASQKRSFCDQLIHHSVHSVVSGINLVNLSLGVIHSRELNGSPFVANIWEYICKFVLIMVTAWVFILFLLFLWFSRKAAMPHHSKNHLKM